LQKLKIEKLVEGGQGISHENEKSFFVWNSLPGELIEIESFNKRKGIFEARAIGVVEPSIHRTEPSEEHFLSCSPWQIMDFDYENEQKISIATENYKRIAKLSDKEVEDLNINIFSDGKQFGYRNKMEFSFIESGGNISLAFFSRGQKRKIAIDGCELASPAINRVAQNILEWINNKKLTERNLKAIILRSNKNDEVVAGLFIKDKLDFDDYPVLNDKFLGFSLYYSTHKSPASVITDTLYQDGQDFLIEEIAGKKFKYGINSFFQVNIPVFEAALKDISDSIHGDSKIVDFYSGVGAIGLCIGADKLIESNEEAVEFAKDNILSNKMNGSEAVLAPSEKALEYIEEDSTIIFDPPRAGLHQDVIDRILEIKPSRIIYMSCNTATHARDIGLLKDVYDIKFLKLYNFFPRTPHIEAICILELKK